MPEYPRVVVRPYVPGIGMRTCGFCAWPSTNKRTADALGHELGHCPVATLNGDGFTVVKCWCPCNEGLIKCFTCGLKESVKEDWLNMTKKEFESWLPKHFEAGAEVDPGTWRCYDQDVCAARIQARLDADPNYQMIKGFMDNSPTKAKVERAARASSRPTSGACLHCDEPTKGGLFLPGHDASFLSAAIKSIAAKQTTLADTLAVWEGLGISEALRAKLEKRAH